MCLAWVCVARLAGLLGRRPARARRPGTSGPRQEQQPEGPARENGEIHSKRNRNTALGPPEKKSERRRQAKGLLEGDHAKNTTNFSGEESIAIGEPLSLQSLKLFKCRNSKRYLVYFVDQNPEYFFVVSSLINAWYVV